MGEIRKRVLVAVLCAPVVFVVLTNYTACCFLLLIAVLLGYREYRGMALMMMELATGREEVDFVNDLQSAPSVLLAQLILPLYCIITQREGLSELPWNLLMGLLLQAIVLFALRILHYIHIKVKLSTPDKADEEHYLLPKYRILVFQATCFDYLFLLFVGLTFSTGLQILHLQSSVKVLLMWFIATWQTDNGCLLFGKLFGKRKIAQFASPNKTVEGVIGGYFLCMLTLLVCNLLLYDLVTPGLQFTQVLIASVVYSTTAVVGDLGESFIKRAAHVKDSSTLLPGHGGLLDRLDSLCLGCPMTFMLVKAFAIK